MCSGSIYSSAFIVIVHNSDSKSNEMHFPAGSPLLATELTDRDTESAAATEGGALQLGSTAGGGVHQGQRWRDHANICLTCKVDRPLRSKHCQVCLVPSSDISYTRVAQADRIVVHFMAVYVCSYVRVAQADRIVVHFMAAYVCSYKNNGTGGQNRRAFMAAYVCSYIRVAQANRIVVRFMAAYVCSYVRVAQADRIVEHFMAAYAWHCVARTLLAHCQETLYRPQD